MKKQEDDMWGLGGALEGNVGVGPGVQGGY